MKNKDNEQQKVIPKPYVFIQDYYPHGAPIFGVWDYKDEAYCLGDGDLYSLELLGYFESKDVQFLSDDELEKILQEHFNKTRG